LSIVIGNPLLSIIRNHFGIQILNFDFIVSKIESIIKLNFELCRSCTPQRELAVGAANNTPACQTEALPARYRRTASLSTYTDIDFDQSYRGVIFFAPLTTSWAFLRDLNLNFEF
jgi:hypothetical protein